eukprot:4438154-Amphidinium_carterae.1
MKISLSSTIPTWLPVSVLPIPRMPRQSENVPSLAELSLPQNTARLLKALLDTVPRPWNVCLSCCSRVPSSSASEPQFEKSDSREV